MVFNVKGIVAKVVPFTKLRRLKKEFGKTVARHYLLSVIFVGRRASMELRMDRRRKWIITLSRSNKTSLPPAGFNPLAHRVDYAAQMIVIRQVQRQPTTREIEDIWEEREGCFMQEIEIDSANAADLRGLLAVPVVG